MKKTTSLQTVRNNLHSIIVSGIILSFVGTGISYGWSGLIASPGDIITATKWNEMINKIYPVYGTGGASGNVGIGDTSPDHKFDVAGNIGLNASSYINFGDVDGSTGYGFRDNAGILQFKNSAGSWANIPSAISGGDNLGNHTATQNIALDTFWLSGDGDSEGVSIDTTGNITLGNSSSNTLTINGTGVNIPNSINYDSNTFYIDATNNRVGIGLNNPSEKLQVSGNTIFGSSFTYIPSVPLNLVNSAAATMKTQLNLVNTGGGGGAGSAIDFYTYDVSGGTSPGLRLGVYDNNYSADFAISTKVPGAATNALIERFRIGSTGNVGIGTNNPTAYLHIKAGTATANTSPLKFTSGVNLTTTESGSMEYDGTQLYFSPSTTRNILSQMSGSTAFTTGSIPFVTTNGYLAQNNSNFFWDNTNNRLGIGITTPNTKFDLNGDFSLRLGSDYTTTGTANDVALGGGTSSTVRYSAAANGTITGISGGQNGKILSIMNASTTNLFTLANESASSVATNRIISGNGQNFTLSPGQATLLQYDSTATRWRIFDGNPKRYVYRMTAAQSSTITTMANVTQLVTGTLPVGAYDLKLRGKFRTAATTTGIGLTLTQQTAVIGDVAASFQAQSTTTANQQLSIIASGTNVTTTAVPAANTDYAFMMNGTFNVTTAGTVAIQMRSEIAASAATLQTGTELVIEPLY